MYILRNFLPNCNSILYSCLLFPPYSRKDLLVVVVVVVVGTVWRIFHTVSLLLLLCCRYWGVLLLWGVGVLLVRVSYFISFALTPVK